MVLQASNIYYLALYRKLGPWLRPNRGHLLSPAVTKSGFQESWIPASLSDYKCDHKVVNASGTRNRIRDSPELWRDEAGAGGWRRITQ